jgi:hypothetical protein
VSFDAIAEAFWDGDTEHEVRPPLTDEAVARAERILGVRLPEAYLSLLLLREWGMPEGFVLLTGDGHWWIALDYRRSGPDGPPSVVWYDNEMDEDVQLAADFETFVHGLRSHWDDDES